MWDIGMVCRVVMVTVDYIMYSGHDIIPLVACYPLWQVEVCMQNYSMYSAHHIKHTKTSPLTGLGGHTLLPMNS